MPKKNPKNSDIHNKGDQSEMREPQQDVSTLPNPSSASNPTIPKPPKIKLPDLSHSMFYQPMVDEKSFAKELAKETNKEDEPEIEEESTEQIESSDQEQQTQESDQAEEKAEEKQPQLEQGGDTPEDDVPEGIFDEQPEEPDFDVPIGENGTLSDQQEQGGEGVGEGGDIPLDDDTVQQEIPDELGRMGAKELATWIASTYSTWIPKLAFDFSKLNINNLKVAALNGQLKNIRNSEQFIKICEEINSNDWKALQIPPHLQKYIRDSLEPALRIKGITADPMTTALVAILMVTVFHVGANALKAKKRNEQLVKQALGLMEDKDEDTEEEVQTEED